MTRSTLDAEACVVGERGLQEDGCATLLLGGHDLGEHDARVIVDGDMDILPAGTWIAAILPLPVTLWPAREKRPSFLMSIRKSRAVH
jgi:hypothetical protein